MRYHNELKIVIGLEGRRLLMDWVFFFFSFFRKIQVYVFTPFLTKVSTK